MPIYDYRCEDCGHRFDRFFRTLEEESRQNIACPRCGSFRLRKLLSVFGMGRTASQACSSGPSKSG